MARCKACGKEFIKSHNRQQYCCEDCRKVSRKQQLRNASHAYYHKHKHEWGPVRRYGMGTGTLGPHSHPDFERESAVIKREKQRLLSK